MDGPGEWQGKFDNYGRAQCASAAPVLQTGEALLFFDDPADEYHTRDLKHTYDGRLRPAEIVRYQRNVSAVGSASQATVPPRAPAATARRPGSRAPASPSAPESARRGQAWTGDLARVPGSATTRLLYLCAQVSAGKRHYSASVGNLTGGVSAGW